MNFLLPSRSDIDTTGSIDQPSAKRRWFRHDPFFTGQLQIQVRYRMITESGTDFLLMRTTLRHDELYDRCARMVMRSTPIRGLNACRWYAKFIHDPVACIRDSYHAHGLLAAVGNILPSSKPERLYALAIGPDFNRQVLGDPNLFHPSGPPRRWGSGHDDSALNRLSYGLTRMTGAKHQQQRRLILPPLQRNAVKHYSGTIVATTDRFLEAWGRAHTLDLLPQIRALSLHISSRTLFDLEEPESANALGHMIQEWITRNHSMGVWICPFDLPGTPFRRLREHAERLEQSILRMVERKRSAPAGSHDVFSLLVHARDDDHSQMTDAELIGQATILLSASYETMSSALTWTLFLLAQHPGVMADLLDELDGTLHGESPTSEQLDQLRLLDAVIHESMRILPPVPSTLRKATCEVELGGLQLKRGDRVILGHYMTHHLPDLYVNPEEFQPRRWFEMTPGQYDYVPFSAGPRPCVGAGFAMTVIKTVLAMALQRFRFSVVPNSRIDRLVQVTMRPKFGMPMVLQRQDRQFQAARVTGNIHEMVRLSSD